MRGKRLPWLFLIGTIVLANLLWFVTFYLDAGVFWIKISISASLLAVISLFLKPKRREQFRVDLKSVLIGLASAVILYGIFWAGKEIASLLFPFAQQQIGGVYAKGEGSRMGIVFLLLFFVTGPGEELYWRGYIQDSLMERFGGGGGFLITVALYAAVHIWSFNFMLIGAAAVAGAFWGAMYWRLGNLVPVIISHSVWSAFIFAVLPLS
ncbi:MAG: CPBP family intramembrane metalloprotease [Deltaproteobacteria bacterium]|nr:CPBP family intramembrane metalloprotease [Deltaproteobacteria bacterium]MBN2844808.1 CPBP family intramembrane metalloprotease [Deltaproteobacteria bacterium]